MGINKWKLNFVLCLFFIILFDVLKTRQLVFMELIEISVHNEKVKLGL